MTIREENFHDYTYKLFYEFSGSKPEGVGLELSRQTTFPMLKTAPETTMVVPIPKKIGEDYAYGGLLFGNTEEERKSMWGLYLASVYHLAAHAAVSDYGIYETWVQNKRPEEAWSAVDFVEDIRVQRFIEEFDGETWRSISQIESKFASGTVGALKKNEGVVPYHKVEEGKVLQMAESAVLKAGREEKKVLVEIADFLYRKQIGLFQTKAPNRERHAPVWLMKFETRGPSLQLRDEMAERAEKLDMLWQTDEIEKAKILRHYKKHMKNLHFDKVIVPQGNLHRYSQTKERVLPMLRRIRQQIRLVSNLTDSLRLDQVGYIDMQMAIQAIASESQSAEIFEQDEIRRGEEAWVILVDKSASMNLRCQELNDLLVCMAESANELTGKYDAWAIYSFDTSFHIVKDFKERYSQEVKARIGAIESGGLTLLPDALELANRLLNEDQRERKYIFVITDGSPSGYGRIQEAFSKIVRKTDISDITLVAIGVSKRVTRGFKNNAQGRDLKTLVAKFITAYRTASSDM